MQVIVQDILTNYEKQGSGPVLLFIHGWGDNGKTFIPLITQLKSSFTCISLDLPGSGSSHGPEVAWSVNNYAEFVLAFVKKTKIDSEVIIGHSNGGTITMFAAARGLLKPKKLILLASAGIRSEDSLKKGAYKIAAKTGKQFTRFLPKNVQQKLRRKLYMSAGSDMLVAPHLEETFKKVVSYDILKDAEKITLPTLLIYAADDVSTPPRYGTMLNSAIKGSRLEVLPGGGHFLHLEQQEKVAELMKAFLK